MPSEPTGGAHPSAVLSAYLEPIARGRRVAILGEATLDLAARLADRGARLVHAYDPEPARVAEAISRSGRGGTVAFAVLEAELGVRDGAFDVVVVPDLSLFGDPGELVRRARRLAGPAGVAVFASPNVAAARPLARRKPGAPKPLGYYELFDVVALQFTTVRMVGQAPFVGYTIADFAPDGEPEVSVDTSILAAAEEPEWFLAVASERPVPLEGYSVIELPIVHFADALSAQIDVDAERTALAEAQARIALMNAELEKFRDQRRERSRDLEARDTSAATMASRLVEIERENEGHAARVSAIEARAGDEHVRAERLAHELREAGEELARQRERATKLVKQLDDEKKARTKADVELGVLRARPETSSGKDRIDALTAELDAALTRIAELEDPITERRPGRTKDPVILAKIAELEAALRYAKSQAVELLDKHEAALARVATLTTTLAQATAAREALELRLAARGAEHLLAVATRDAQLDELTKHATESVAADVAVLEATLRERGALIAKLTAELRESERIGREIVGELEEALAERPAATPPPENGAPPVPPGAPGTDPSSTRFDALAVKAAKAEADAHTASWRVAELERRLLDAELERTDPSATQVELEQALVAARQEIAALRGAIGPGRDRGDLERAVMEQSALLQQVAASQDPVVSR